MDLQAIITAGILTAAILGLGFWWKRRHEPKHVFMAHDLEVGSVQPKRIKNIHGPFVVKLPNGKGKVRFPVVSGFGRPRMDGKGLVFEGDIHTGQLIKPNRDGSLFEAVNGVFVELALADGRVQQIASAQNGGSGLKLEHLLIVLGIIMALVIFNVYQFSRYSGAS